jgi:alpha-galactosidase
MVLVKINVSVFCPRVLRLNVTIVVRDSALKLMGKISVYVLMAPTTTQTVRIVTKSTVLVEDAFSRTTVRYASVMMKRIVCQKQLSLTVSVLWIVEKMLNVEGTYKKVRKFVFARMVKAPIPTARQNQLIVAKALHATLCLNILFTIVSVNAFARNLILCTQNVHHLYVALKVKLSVRQMGKSVPL